LFGLPSAVATDKSPSASPAEAPALSPEIAAANVDSRRAAQH
jgi:hypothetical protein